MNYDTFKTSFGGDMGDRTPDLSHTYRVSSTQRRTTYDLARIVRFASISEDTDRELYETLRSFPEIIDVQGFSQCFTDAQFKPRTSESPYTES